MSNSIYLASAVVHIRAKPSIIKPKKKQKVSIG